MLPVYKSPPLCAVLWLLVRNRKDRRWGQWKSLEPLFYLFNFLLLLLAILAKEEQMEQGCAVGLQFLLLLMKRERKGKWTRDTKINALNNSRRKPETPFHLSMSWPCCHMCLFDNHILSSLHLPQHGGMAPGENGGVLDTDKQGFAD